MAKHVDFFIASRWRNKDAVLSLTEKLRARGKTVYCFIESDGTENEILARKDSHAPEEYMQLFENTPNWQSNSAIRHLFEIDMDALKNSKALILLLPAGKSAHIEAGVAFGMKKKCILIGEQKEAESLYLIFAESYQTIDEFIDGLL